MLLPLNSFKTNQNLVNKKKFYQHYIKFIFKKYYLVILVTNEKYFREWLI